MLSAFGQSIVHLPKPSEVPKEERKDYRQEIRQAKQNVQSLEDQGFDFWVDVLERVAVPQELGVQSSDNDSWGREYHAPDGLYQRFENECTNAVTLCIDDTKVDESHYIFKPYWFRPAQNYTTEPANAPYNRHGTHVFGITEQVLRPLLNNGTVKAQSNYVLTSQGGGSFSWVSSMTAQERTKEVQRRAAGEATVHNQSFGATAPPIQFLEDQYRLSVESGTYFVGAAGNTGGETNSYPASSPYTIAVASLDQNGKVSSFSTKGDFVIVAGAGGLIRSTTPNDKIETLSGTSMASPFIAAGAVIALSKWGMEKIPDQNALQAYLQKCATDIPPTGKDNASGWGTVFFTNILDTDPSQSEPPVDEPDQPEQKDYTVSMSTGGFTMAWSEGLQIGQGSRVLTVPYLECDCTGKGETVEEVRAYCELYFSEFFTNRGLLGVPSPQSAAYWSGRFASMLSESSAGIKISIPEKGIEGVDENGYNYFASPMESKAPQSYQMNSTENSTRTVEIINIK